MAILSMQSNHLYSVFFAPRGNARMVNLGMHISQQYLNPFDKLIGIIGEAGSGKSKIVKGMFPGLELCNDDEGVNVRPLPILDIDATGFYSAHTYHLDMRFELAFTQMHVLADAVLNALSLNKRVVIEHFDLLRPFINMNAQLLIGVGEEVIITRPTIFGPEPQDIFESVSKSGRYRKMAHTAEDICEYFFPEEYQNVAYHGDVKHGFYLGFEEKPDIDLEEIERKVKQSIAEDLPVSYHDDEHIMIGTEIHRCTGPRIHVKSSGEVENFRLIKEFIYDPVSKHYLLVGLIGDEWKYQGRDINGKFL